MSAARSLLLTGALLAAVPAFLPVAARASDPMSEAQVLARLGRVRSLTASFIQSKKLRIFAHPKQSQGHLSFVRGGALVWEYTAPQRSRLEVRSGRATLTWPDLGRTEEFELASNAMFKGIVDSMFLWLEADAKALRRDYEVVFRPGPPATLQLSPRADGMRRAIASMTFTFGTDGLVHRLQLREPDDDETDIQFTDTRVEEVASPR